MSLTTDAIIKSPI